MKKQQHPHVAIFFLDALRYKDINDDTTPFLASMMSKGTGGPLETLLAYEGIAATILTGTYPEQHGVWTRYYKDVQNSPFKWINPLASLLEKMDGPLTSTRAKVMRYAIMRLSTILSGISYFPGLDEVPLKELAQLDFSIKKKLFEPNCFSPIPSLFDILIANHLSYRYVDHDLFDTDETVCQKALSRDFVENVTVVRLVDLDTASHRYGLESQERNRIIRQTDSLVEKTISTWKGQHDDLFTVCFADHGMVVAEKFLDIEKILSQSGLRIFQDYDTFLDSTIARFWATNQILEKITMILSHRDEGRILSSFERKQYHIPSSDKYGQLIFLANPGYVISPNFFEKHSQVKAMHGYDPATPGLETFLSVEGPLIHQLGRKNRLSMVDVLPTMLETLNLPIPDYCTGHSIVGNSPR